MIVKNPLNEELTINYKGEHFTVPADGEVSVPDVVAEYWKSRIHEFIELKKETVKEPIKVSVPEVTTEEILEKVSELVSEDTSKTEPVVKASAPKKVIAKKK